MDNNHVLASLQAILKAVNMAKITVNRAMANTTTDKAMLELSVIDLALAPMAQELVSCMQIMERKEHNDTVALLERCLALNHP